MERIDLRRFGNSGMVTQRRWNAFVTADAIGGSGVVWYVGKDEMGGKELASNG